MSEIPLSADVASTFQAIGVPAGIEGGDPVAGIIGEVESVIGAYRSPERIAADEEAQRAADEAMAQSYRQPVEITPEKLSQALRERMPVTAGGLGPIGMTHAARALSAIPKDVLVVMDDAGALATGESWQLLHDIGQRLAVQPMSLEPPPPHDFTGDDIREGLGARLDGLPADAADALAILLNSLPPATLAAMDGLENDPDVLELGVHLGRKLWGFEPPRSSRKETSMTTRKPPANAEDLIRQARKLQASDAYANTGDPDHQKVRQTVTRIYQTVYPPEKEGANR